MGDHDGVRMPDLAGSWYPDRASAVLADIERFRERARGARTLTGRLAGGIVPHAGWSFSGRLAYHVLFAVAASGPAPDVIAIFGKHMGARAKPTIMRRGRWQTPLGPIDIAADVADFLLREHELVEETAERYEQDNTIELQLPFVKALFPESALLPIGAPARSESMAIGTAVTQAAERAGRTLCVLGSTDLTHYGPNYGFAPKGGGPAAERWVREENDRVLIDRLVAMEPELALDHAAEHRSACCPGAAIAALAAARALGASGGELLDYATSNDVRPGGASFVGYAAIVFG